MAMEAGASAHLLHVIDDHSFYESDWRLKGIIGLLGESIPLHLGIAAQQCIYWLPH